MKSLQCPSCDNRYSERFSDCPECDIPLLKPDTLQLVAKGDNNQNVFIRGENRAPIINKSRITINSGAEIATYERKPLRRFPSVMPVLMPWLVGEIGVSIVGAVEWLGNWASVFSFLGANPSQANVWRWALMVAAAGYGIFALVRIFYLLELSSPNRWVQFDRRQYRSNDDGSVDLSIVSAKCPVEGCAGTLYPQKTPDNIEGVPFAALCSKHKMHHAFEFNGETNIGQRIKLTPKPKENNNKSS